MLTFLTRRKVLTDTSSMEIARVTELLKENNVKYELVTKKNQSTFGNMIHGSMGASVGGGGAFTHSQSVGAADYVYHIYVAAKDFGRATEIIS